MANNSGSLGFFYSFFQIKNFLSFLIASFVAVNCSGQTQQSPDAANPAPTLQASSQSSNQSAAPKETMITVPAGTHLPLVLVHPVDSRSTREVRTQITAPVVVDEKVVIPAGTFVQGRVQALTRRGSRAEIVLQPASLVFANGYVATISGALSLETDDETAWANPSTATKLGIFTAPEIGLGIGAAIGSAMHTTDSSTLGGQTITASTPKGLAIGSVSGLAAGGVVALVLLARSHHFYVEAGSPIEASLIQPTTLSQAQISDAVSKAATQPPPMPVRANPPPSSTQAGSTPSGPASCAAGREWCNGECMDSSDFINDSSNCGRCGNHCSISESCTGGSCGCAPGYESCMGRCLNSAMFFSDTFNCGRCGNSCSGGESCLGGTCRKPGMSGM